MTQIELPPNQPTNFDQIQTQDPNGSFFETELSDEEIMERINSIPSALFSLKDPTEIEVLDAVFIALGYLPTEDDILNFENLGDTHSSMQLRKIRDSFLGNTRLAINLFRNEYFEDGTRSTDKIVELYEQTDYADNDIIVKALRILGAQHRSSETIKNSEATIRLMYLASSE
jgi:hypothetical protein